MLIDKGGGALVTVRALAVDDWSEWGRMRRALWPTHTVAEHEAEMRTWLTRPGGTGRREWMTMPRLNQVRCVLAVNDLAKSADFYREKLGFKLDFEVQGWCFLSRDTFKVMLGHCPDEVPAVKIGDHAWFVYVYLDDIDGLYSEYRGNGVKIIEDLGDKPWGMREFGVETPDGHRIMFGQELGPKPRS